MDLGLKNKIAIVTGGAKGIGAGISEVLAEEGVNIVIADFAPLEETDLFADQLRQTYGIKVLAVKADIGKPEDIENIYKETLENFGTVDILMNNAGIGGPLKFDDITLEILQKYEKVNLEGVFLMTAKFIRICLEQNKGGHIVNTLSKSAFTTNSGGNTPYIATKGAISAYTRGLAKEMGPKGIYINAIIPGYVDTPGTSMDPNRSSSVLKYIPSGKLAQPKEIGYVSAFLCSEKACQMMGVLVDVTGGTML